MKQTGKLKAHAFWRESDPVTIGLLYLHVTPKMSDKNFLHTVSHFEDTTLFCSIQVSLAKISLWKIKQLSGIEKKDIALGSLSTFNNKKISSAACDEDILIVGFQIGRGMLHKCVQFSTHEFLVLVINLSDRTQEVINVHRTETVYVLTQKAKKQFFSSHIGGAVFHYRLINDKWVGSKLIQEKETGKKIESKNNLFLLPNFL